MRTFLSVVYNHIVFTTVLTALIWVIGSVITNTINFFAWDIGAKIITLVMTNALAIAVQAGLKEEELL